MLFVNVIQKNGKEYTSAVYNFDTIQKAKEKAYQELNYGFSGTLDMCTVYITDEYANVIFRDAYKKKEEPKEEPNASNNK